MNKIRLNKTLSRVHFPCEVGSERCLVLFDPGSPNTIISQELTNLLKIKTVGNPVTIGVSGESVFVAPIVVPSIKLGSETITNVRVLAGLGSKWKRTIILGLNVLNYFHYSVNRAKDPGHIWLELTGRPGPDTGQSKFDHLLSNKGYYIVDPAEQMETW